MSKKYRILSILMCLMLLAGILPAAPALAGTELLAIRYKYIDTGYDHSVVIKSDGTIWTFGDNTEGQLGVGKRDENYAVIYGKDIPAQVRSGQNTADGYFTGAIAVAAGFRYTLALKEDGTVWGWGNNQYGQLGVSKEGTYDYRYYPVKAALPANVKIVAIDASTQRSIQMGFSSSYRSLALAEDGTVWQWGGMGSNTYIPKQVEISAGNVLGNIVAIAAGAENAVALDKDGEVWVWGDTVLQGAAGSTPVKLSSLSAVQFLGMPKITAIAAGAGHTLLLDVNSNVWAWGYNEQAQVGIGQDSQWVPVYLPTKVKNSAGANDYLSGVTAIAAGDYHSLARKDDGSLWGWGGNGYGSIGDNTFDSRTYYPVRTQNSDGSYFSGTVHLAAGNHTSMVLDQAGKLYTWGSDSYGALGDNRSENVHKYNPPQTNKNYANHIMDGVGAPIPTYIVSFDSNGGSPVPTLAGVKLGNTITRPQDPQKEGFVFVGWYKEQTLTNLWDFSTDTVSGHVTLYAKWTKPAPGFNPIPAPKPGEDPDTTSIPEVTPGAGHRLAVKISSTLIPTPGVGDEGPTGEKVTDPYIKGADIVGADPVTYRYIGLYELDGNGKVVKFSLMILKSENISSGMDEDYENLSIIYAEGDSQDHVTKALFLATKGKSGRTDITWTSGIPEFITPTGRVTRPGAGGSDTVVTLTATIKDRITGKSRNKVFNVIVIKLSSSEEEDIKKAAKDLTIDKAFTFAPGDTWESVTSEFLLLNGDELEGVEGITINWSSNASQVIGIAEKDHETRGIVTRPSSRDANVVLSAKISKGNISMTKTFLLVVKNSTVTKEIVNTRKDSGRNAILQATGEGSTQQNNANILRTALSDNTKIDTVILNGTVMKTLTDQVNPTLPEAERTVSVAIYQSESTPADEIAIEIPVEAIHALAERNALFHIQTGEGSVKISADALANTAVQESDLYFRIVPVKNGSEQSEAKGVLAGNPQVIQAANGKSIQSLGIPRKIETNFTGYKTMVVLPLTGIQLPASNLNQFLSELRIFIEHDDSTELLVGQVVYENTVPVGIQFEINKFSRFQIVNFVSSGSPGGEETPEENTPIPAGSVDQKPKVEITVGNKKQEDLGEGVLTHEGTTKKLTVTIDPEKVRLLLDQEPGNSGLRIRDLTGSDSVEVVLNAALVQKMGLKKQVVEIEKEGLRYRLPAAGVDVEAIRSALGNPKNLEDIKIVVTIAEADKATSSALKNKIQKNGTSMVGTPVRIDITCRYSGKEIKLKEFNQYAQLRIQLPQGIDHQKITTGVYEDRHGKIAHTPTKVEIVDGIYYATVNSFYPGIYPLIYNPLEMKDVVSHWSRDYVNDMASRLVVLGTGEGNYTPDRPITRAEFSSILVKALGLKYTEGVNRFQDVQQDQWYAEAIITATDYKLIKGYGDGNFGPEDTITREQGMTIIARAMTLTGLSQELTKEAMNASLRSFIDAAEIADWAQDSIARCILAGIVQGKENGSIAPEAYITRAEVAAMVRKLLQQSDLIEK